MELSCDEEAESCLFLLPSVLAEDRIELGVFSEIPDTFVNDDGQMINAGSIVLM